MSASSTGLSFVFRWGWGADIMSEHVGPSRPYDGILTALRIPHGPSRAETRAPCTDDHGKTPGLFPPARGPRPRKVTPAVGPLPAARGGLGPSSLLEHPALCTTRDKTDVRPESLETGDWATGP